MGFLQGFWKDAYVAHVSFLEDLLPRFCMTFGCMCAYVYGYPYTCICVCMRYIPIYDVHTCMHACMHACIHTCVHAYVRTCVRAYVRIYLHMYIRAYVHAYTRTYMHTYMGGSADATEEGFGGCKCTQVSGLGV